jgi:glutathione S-transferase
LKINPAGVVPAIQEGDFILGEGAAILAYIADSRGLADWYPTDLKARAKVNYWLHWHHGALRRSTTKILVPTIHKTPVSDAELEAFRQNLTFLNTHLEHSTFVASDSHPTIADLFLITEIDQLTEAGFAVFDYAPYPNVVRYLQSVKNGVSSYDEVFAPLAAQTILPRGNAPATNE